MPNESSPLPCLLSMATREISPSLSADRVFLNSRGSVSCAKRVITAHPVAIYTRQSQPQAGMDGRCIGPHPGRLHAHVGDRPTIAGPARWPALPACVVGYAKNPVPG